MESNKFDRSIAFGTQECTRGGNSQTAMVPPGFRTRCISGNSLSKGSKGKGITPNKSTMSTHAACNSVFTASFWTIRTLFKFSFLTFSATTSRNPDEASIAIKDPFLPIIFAAGMVKKTGAAPDFQDVLRRLDIGHAERFYRVHEPFSKLTSHQQAGRFENKMQ